MMRMKRVQLNSDKALETVGKSAQEKIAMNNHAALIRDQLNNQSTDCDDIVPQFKNNYQNQAMKIGGNQIDNQNSIENESKGKKDIQQKQKQNKDSSSSSSPSSTSSEDVQQPKISGGSSHSSCASAKQQQNSGCSSSSSKNDIKQDQPKSQLNKQSNGSVDINDNALVNNGGKVMKSGSQQSSSNIKEEEKKEIDEQSSENESDDDDDDDPSHSLTSFVVEVSPKGRFKRFGEELGRGAYKIVYKGVDCETGREIAWNVINLNRLPKQDRIRIKSEIELIKKLQHKNIIHFISAWFNKEKEQVVFITEMITGGSLRKYVKKIKTPRLKVVKGWCIEILNGLAYLHEQDPHPIIHRDLKCDNIFINSNSGEIRIGDLGLSTPMANSYTTSVLGTPEFMAPELYEECYDTSVDIYAFGMCVLEMITLERPYKECQNPAQIYSKVIQGIRPKALDRVEDDDVKQFILTCLTRAENRPTARDLLESKFLKDMESEKNNHEVQIRPLPKDKVKKIKKSLRKHNGSTILEEEEENNSEGASTYYRNATLAAQKEALNAKPTAVTADKGPFVIARQSSKEEEKKEFEQPIQQNQSQSDVHRQMRDGVEIKGLNQREKTKSDPLIENPADNTDQAQDEQYFTHFTSHTLQNYTLIQQNQTDDQEAQVNGSNDSSSDDDDQPQNSQGKVDKQSNKNQKLNESVIFLKQIDKEKQKKLFERTLLQQQIDDENNNDDNSDHNSDQKNQENILDEIKQMDMKEAQAQYEQQQKLEQQAKDHSMDITNQPQNKQSYSQRNIDSQQQQQIIQRQNTPQSQNEGSQGTNYAPTGSVQDQLEKKKVEIKKNFKEDEQTPTPKTTSNILPQNQNQQQQQIVQQQSTKKVTNTQNESLKPCTSDDLKRQSSFINLNIFSSQGEPQLPVKQQQQAQQITDKRKDHIHQQHSDGILLNAPVQSISKSALGGSLIAEEAKQDQKVFDIQTSSEQSDNQDRDQDSERIKLPRAQDDLQNLNNQPLSSTPSQQDGYFRQQNADYRKSNTITAKASSNNQAQFSQIASQSQAQQPSAIQNKSQVKQYPEQQPVQQRDVNKIVAGQQQKPLKEAQISANIFSSTHNQQPQKQQPPPQQNLPLKSQSHVQVILSSDSALRRDNKINMSFKIKSGDGGPEKEVTFDFNVKNDTPIGVAAEMVKELQLNQNYIDIISKQIQAVIEKARQHLADAKQIQHQKSQLQQQQPIQPPQVQQQLPQQQNQGQQLPTQIPKKKSPVKITKETAVGYLNKLYEGIDVFFAMMQSKGIESTDEIIEAIEGTPEEQQIRLEFLNNVFQAKRTYKKNMEAYKIKIQNRKKQANSTPAGPINGTVTPDSQQKGVKASNEKVQEFSQQQKIQQKASGVEFNVITKNTQLQENKQPALPNEKLVYMIPSYVKKQFKTAPQQFTCYQRLSCLLKRISDEPSSPDEEVSSLQNVLNLIFQFSIIQLQKKPNPTDENKQTVQNYLPLRIDGFFGDKTESHVMKVQKHLQLHPDGMVSDTLWTALLNFADQIVSTPNTEEVKESKKGQSYVQPQSNQSKDLKNSALNVNNQNSSQTSQQQKQQPINKDKLGTSSLQVTTSAVKPQQQSQQQLIPQLQSPIKNKKQQLPQQQQHQVIDYNKVIEQAFRYEDYINQDGQQDI